MGKWEHLLVDGEFADRRQIVAGLTLEQVTHKLSEQSHTIYDELWHTVKWQNIVVERDHEQYKEWQKGKVYPDYPEGQPETEEEWTELVDEFLSGLNKAIEWTTSPERLNMETSPDSTMADVLRSLAVHSSYHLGKIVAIRQAINAWPPESQT